MVLADGIVVRASPVVGGGKGLFATSAIAAGAMVWREDSDAEPHYTSVPRSAAWVAALPAGAQRAYRHFMCVVAATAAQPSGPLRAGGSGRCVRGCAWLTPRRARGGAGTKRARTSIRACLSSTRCRQSSSRASYPLTRPCASCLRSPAARHVRCC